VAVTAPSAETEPANRPLFAIARAPEIGG